MTEVTFTVSNVDERYESKMETLKRINTVVGLLRNNGHIPTEITRLHDHEGKLIVTWAQQPAFGETEFLRELWREVSQDEVIHQVTE